MKSSTTTQYKNVYITMAVPAAYNKPLYFG